MTLKDHKWDNLLRIRTTGWDASNADSHHFPYEPTSYSVLERLAYSGYINKKNKLLDYGCGKGRVDFFLSYQTKCKSIGVEYDERIYIDALGNSEFAVSKKRVSFHLGSAEEYISYLMTEYNLEFVDEIECMDLFDGENKRERIIIFQVV